MSERTEITINVYAGVPFNKKYQNVLFVTRETRDSFLSMYEIGTELKANRFEIINDTEATIDVTTNFETMSVNYCKIHRTLILETTGETFEYDAFYFINTTRQIATNVVRLYLELDVFQTHFNKYDYQKQEYEIPTVKNSRVEISTDFNDVDEKYSVLADTVYNKAPSISSLIPKDQTYTKVNAIMHFTTDNGEYTAISQYSMAIYPATSTFPNDLKTLMNAIYNKDNFYFDSASQKINVINLYLVPAEFLKNADFSNFTTGYYSYTYNGQTVHANFYVSSNVGVPAIEYDLTKTYTPTIDTQAYIGTISNRINLPFNSKSYSITIKFLFGNVFQMFLMANNETIELTNDFEYSLLESSFAEYMQQHSNGMALKNISNAINMFSSITGLAKGNPASILSLTNTITGIASEYASLIDLNGQPLKINAQTTCLASLLVYNGIGIFESEPANKNEIIKTEKYFGHKMNLLTNLTFTYKGGTVFEPDESVPPVYVEVKYNFDYYKFTNIELICKIPENFKSQIEQMFLNGIRIWYQTDTFLNTIEHKEYIE